MVDHALSQLIVTLLRGALRRIVRQLKTPSGALMALIMMGILVGGVIPGIVVSAMNADALDGITDAASAVAPLLFFAFTAVLVGSDQGSSFMELQPAELQFVLAGPFSDKQILSYRLMTLGLSLCPMALFFGCFAAPYIGNLIGAVVGIALIGAFVFLLAMLRALLTPRLTPLMVRAITCFAYGSLILTIGEIALRYRMLGGELSAQLVAQLVAQSWSVSVLSLPFQPFANVMFGSLNLSTATYFLISVAMVLLAAVCCYRFNVGFSELAVEGVGRRTKKLARLKSGNLFAARVSKPTVKRSIRSFPWLHGVGPIAWLQITTSTRRVGRILPLLAVLSLVGVVGAKVFLATGGADLTVDDLRKSMLIAMGAASYLGFIMTPFNQSGFGAAAPLLTWYRQLPIPAWSMAAGMVSGSTLILWAARLAIFFPATVLCSQSWAACFGILSAGLAVDIAYVSAMSFVGAATGLRPIPTGSPNVLQGAQTMVFMLAVSCTLLPSFLAGAVGVLVAAIVTKLSWVTCSFGFAIGTVSLQPILWWAAGHLFFSREDIAT